MCLTVTPWQFYLLCQYLKLQGTHSIFHYCESARQSLTKYWQEYERAVIFRLGRLVKGGARGPGVFFIIPCVDSYDKIDMRSMTFEIPPQEVILAESF